METNGLNYNYLMIVANYSQNMKQFEQFMVGYMPCKYNTDKLKFNGQ